MKKGLAGLLLFGVIAFVACQKSTVTPTVYQQFTADSLLIVNYLADNHINAVAHDSVWYVISEMGTGAYPTRYNCVSVKYIGTELGAAAPFETNTDSGLKGPLKGLISGMQIGLKRFPNGTKGTLYIPSALGYGASGKTDNYGAYVVHPNTVLVFNIELFALSDYNVLGNYCYE
ncbi:MAG: FKBP-type peptidyl-prolyl cis-trans isomerase [Bacteroidota bacterium]